MVSPASGLVEHAALEHPRDVLQANAARQFLRTGDARRGQFDAGDVGAISMGQIAHRPAEAGAEIGHAHAFRYLRAAGQFVGGCKAPVMVLVKREEIVGGEAVEMAPTCPQL